MSGTGILKIFNNFGEDLLMRIPLAHGEGRFTTLNNDLLQILTQNEQTIFKYCDKNGETKKSV